MESACLARRDGRRKGIVITGSGTDEQECRPPRNARVQMLASVPETTIDLFSLVRTCDEVFVVGVEERTIRCMMDYYKVSTQSSQSIFETENLRVSIFHQYG